VRTLITLLLLLVGAGCATSRWERPGANDAERARDETECQARADRERAVVGRRIVSSSRGQVNESIELVPRREFDFALFDACMRSRGYRRVPAASPGPSGRSGSSPAPPGG
jgi:hypothetical protein